MPRSALGPRWRVATATAGLLTLSAWAAARGQEGPAGRRLFGGGVGIATANISVGDASGSASGLTAHGRLGVATGSRTLLLLDGELQPFEVTNPARAEAFRSTYILLAVQRYVAQRLYARAGVGFQYRRWSGADPVTDSDAGVALGVALGGELPLASRLFLTPEIVLDWAFIEAEGSVSARLFGLRAGLARRF